MKKYFMSMIDFSEVRFFTDDLTDRENTEEKLCEAGLLTPKGNISNAEIAKVNADRTPQFLQKVVLRLERRINGFTPVRETFNKMYGLSDYSGMYLYLAFLYGFIGWRMPLEINLISGRQDMLKAFFDEFMQTLSEITSENPEEGTDEAE